MKETSVVNARTVNPASNSPQRLIRLESDFGPGSDIVMPQRGITIKTDLRIPTTISYCNVFMRIARFLPDPSSGALTVVFGSENLGIMKPKDVSLLMLK